MKTYETSARIPFYGSYYLLNPSIARLADGTCFIGGVQSYHVGQHENGKHRGHFHRVMMREQSFPELLGCGLDIVGYPFEWRYVYTTGNVEGVTSCAWEYIGTVTRYEWGCADIFGDNITETLFWEADSAAARFISNFSISLV